MFKTYSEMARYETFEERFRYLRLEGSVGMETFGFDRYLNQKFYSSPEWKRVRDYVIARDLGCDLGVPGYEILDKILVHHMNPITPQEVLDRSSEILDPEYLICVTHRTHNSIHYGDEYAIPQVVERQPGDTKLW